ncbi:MAG TPA: CvpA family protein [Myxococcales bacterium]|nr:CvpA family protein [Myxococcales bacterium]
MNFDLALLALVGLLALWGAYRGLLRQLFGIIGFVGGIVLARLFSQPFGDAFAKDLGLPVAVATAAMAIAIFLAAEIAAKLIGGFLHARMTGGFTGAVEHGGGFLLGAAKGVLVAWAVASLVALLRPHLQHLEHDTPAAKLDLAHSRVVALAREVNLITELRAQPHKT